MKNNDRHEEQDNFCVRMRFQKGVDCIIELVRTILSLVS